MPCIYTRSGKEAERGKIHESLCACFDARARRRVKKIMTDWFVLRIIVGENLQRAIRRGAFGGPTAVLLHLSLPFLAIEKSLS